PDGVYGITVVPWWGEGPSAMEPGVLRKRNSGTITIMEHHDPALAVHGSSSLPSVELHVGGVASAISEEELLGRIMGPLVQAIAALDGRAQDAEPVPAIPPANDGLVEVA